MKKWLFKDSFTLHSELSVDEVMIRLSFNIEPAPIVSWRWPWQKPRTPYHGEVTPSGFKAIRIIDYQNSFLPRIRGKIDSLTGLTAIHITMTPNPFVLGVSLCWKLFGFGMVLPLYLSGPQSILTYIFLSLPIVFGFLDWLAFWAETRRSRKDFIRITAGRLQRPLRTDALGFQVETKP